jgi:arylformamidase
MADFIDITRPLSERLPVWPGDVSFHRQCREEQLGGRVCRVSQMSVGLHLGTHLDAPSHLSNGPAATVDETSLEVLIGPARVIDARGLPVIGAELIESQLQCPPRVLLRTDNSERPYNLRSYVALGVDAAQALVKRGCLLVGVDGPSPDPPDSVELPVHRCLLDAAVVLVEGLDLGAALPGDYELICLPMSVAGAEAAPVRAVLRTR